jgi:hypothetical protein
MSSTPLKQKLACILGIANQSLRTSLINEAVVHDATTLRNTITSPDQQALRTTVRSLHQIHAASAAPLDGTGSNFHPLTEQVAHDYMHKKNAPFTHPNHIQHAVASVVAAPTQLFVKPELPPPMQQLASSVAPVVPTQPRASTWNGGDVIISEHGTLEAAKHHLGPQFSAERNIHVNKGTAEAMVVYHYACNHSRPCPARARIYCHTASHKSQCRLLFNHNHKVVSWKDHVDNGSYGLPPHVKKVLEKLLIDPLSRSMGNDEILRHLEERMRDEPIFSQPSSFQILKSKVYTFIVRYRKRALEQDVNPELAGLHTTERINCTFDTVHFKENHMLTIPKDHVAQPIMSDEHLQQTAKYLETVGALRGKKHAENVPHRDLVVLPFPTADHPLMQIVQRMSDERRKKEPLRCGDAILNTVVFSSLALLRTVCDMISFKFRVPGSIDGTHGSIANKWILLTLALLSFEKRDSSGKKAYACRAKPVVFAAGEGEREEVAILCLVAIKHTVLLLFGIDLVFPLGIISDRAMAFVNAINKVFNTKCIQCHPHLSSKSLLLEGRECVAGATTIY